MPTGDHAPSPDGSSHVHPSRALWLLRHGEAKAGARGGDMARRLAPRGRRDAIALGRRLAAGMGAFGLSGQDVPHVILCSAAVRTRQTADLVAGAMGGEPTVEAYRSLYGAGPHTVLRYVNEIDDSHRSALIVGHNPTVFELALDLLDGGGPEERGEPEGRERPGDPEILRRHGFPTCGLAVLALDTGPWAEVSSGRARLAGLFAPPY